MLELNDKPVLVIGLGQRGRAACALLRRAGAKVTAVDAADTEALRTAAGPLRAAGVEVELGIAVAPPREFSLAVVGPSVRADAPILQALAARQIPVVGEFELGLQQSRCLSIAVTGTNGKGTTAELI